MKKTEESHPDYPHLKKAFDTAKGINVEIDKKMADYQAITKMNRLFGEYDNIFQPTRKYITEIWMCMLCTDLYCYKDNERKVRLHIMTDLIVISDFTDNHKILSIYLDEESKVIKLKDGSIISNLLKIQGKN